jgi:uncharacterized protein YoxC
MQEITLIVWGVVLLLIAGIAIPVLLEIRQMAKGMDQTLQLLNQSLPGIMKNLEEITTTIHRTTTTVNREVEELSLTVRKVQGTVSLIIGLEEIFRRRIGLPFARTLRTSLAVARGVRIFAEYLLRDRPGGRT